MKTSKQVLRALTVLALSGTLATSVSGLAGIAKADNVSDTKAKISDNKSDTAKLLAKVQELQSKVDQINNQVSGKVVDIQNNQKAIVAVTSEIAAFDGKITAAQKEVTGRTNVLKKQLVALQKQSANSVSGNVYLDFILNSKDFSDLINRSMTVNKLSDANKDALDAVNAAKKKLATLRQDKAEKKQALVTKEAALEQQKSQLDDLKSQAQKQQDQYNNELNDHKGELAALENQLKQQNEDAVKKLQEETAKQAAAQPVVAASNKSASSNNAASGSSSNSQNNGGSNAATPSAPSSSKNMGGLIANVQQFLGVPYVWGGTTPSGFDCSGLIYYAANLSGISLPRTSQAQSTVGSYVSVSDLQAGDLVFWGGVGSAYHVGIYIGNGQYIHAPQPGQSVTVQSVQYFRPDFGRRI
ncbi:MAG: NlpC/P60 family protein [Schleiferilactobacillus perolens]|uniref:C40 family peptidase n=1 Tax=Schleiferilactobacillus perolens TaxID=100468 RepID=UPI0039EA72B8|nr:NlpC/P60 family protein [Schleiferilactobacillus harbinensis]MCI1914071.1 NlpC/P60 family protein [Schleiferilactobacillus harbinensis]